MYLWHQTISEVEIDIPLPPGATKKDLTVSISNGHLTVGLVGLPPYLDVSGLSKLHQAQMLSDR